MVKTAERAKVRSKAQTSSLSLQKPVKWSLTSRIWIWLLRTRLLTSMTNNKTTTHCQWLGSTSTWHHKSLFSTKNMLLKTIQIFQTVSKTKCFICKRKSFSSQNSFRSSKPLRLCSSKQFTIKRESAKSASSRLIIFNSKMSSWSPSLPPKKGSWYRCIKGSGRMPMS